MQTANSTRPLWWTRQFLDSYTLSAEEAWDLVQNPPWKCVVAWVTKDCKPVACEMAYAILDGQIVLTSTSNRDKVKALRRNPAICLCFSGSNLRQVTVRGHVEISEDPLRVRQWAETTVATMDLPLAESKTEIERYLSPDRVTITVIVDTVRSFDGAKMFRDERAAERDPDASDTASPKA